MIGIMKITRAPRNQGQLNLLICGQQQPMILKSLNILSQNVCKNKLFTGTFLKNCKDYNILFIQGSLQSIIHYIPCTSSKEGKKIIKAFNHLSQILFTKNFNDMNDFPRVLTYINTKLFFLIQQFITQSAQVDCGSYVVTTYKANNTT